MDSSEPGFKFCGSAKRTRSAAPHSASTGPTCPVTTTCARSEWPTPNVPNGGRARRSKRPGQKVQVDLQEVVRAQEQVESMSSSAAGPAKTSALLAPSVVWRGVDLASGSSMSESSMKSNPVLSCAKTCPACSQPQEDDFLAYAAGVIDGEGWIGVIHHHTTKYPSAFLPSVQVEMSMKALPVLNALYSNFGGQVKVNRAKSGSQSSTAAWRVHGEPTGCVLRRIRPWLRLKRRQADLVIEATQDRSLEKNAAGRRVWTSARVEMWRRVTQQIRELNAKGSQIDPHCLAELVGDRWITRTASLFGERWATFSGPFPREGFVSSGRCFAQPMLERRTAGPGSSSLPTEDWLTPTQHPAASSNNGSNAGQPQSGKSPMRQIRGEWPTSTSADGERTSLQYPGNHNPTLLGACWPTPRAEDAECAGERVSRGRTDTLLSRVREKTDEWITPQARDARGITQGVALGDFTDALPDQLAGLHDRVNGSTPGSLPGQSPRPMLNPRWVLTLMGFPSDWLDGVSPDGDDRA